MLPQTPSLLYAKHAHRALYEIEKFFSLIFTILLLTKQITMKNSVLKTSASIAVIIISFSVGYYFFFFLPSYKQNVLFKENTEQILKKQIECQKIGMALHEKELASMEVAFVPTFKFSSKLNTCLYKGGWFSGSATSGAQISWFIKDAYSNKEIVSYTTFTRDGKSHDFLIDGLVSREEFERQEKELLGE